jgi:hypothetical protein
MDKSMKAGELAASQKGRWRNIAISLTVVSELPESQQSRIRCRKS